MITRVLVANRGEIAVRVIRACRELGLDTVAVYSDADAGSRHTLAAHRAVRIGPAPSTESYLSASAILAAAAATGTDAVHPGYGFLSENADFADACAAAGLTFIGPPGDVIRRLGSKIAARALATSVGVATVPGETPADQSTDAIVAAAMRVGLPVAVAVFVLDQLSKWWVLGPLDVARAPRLRVLPFLDVVLVWNPGISFGMLQSGSSFAPWLLTGFAVVVVIALLIWMRRAQSRLLGVALGLAVGGALGNVVDRLRFGRVVDFLFVHLGSFDWWPVFNIADAAIVVGFIFIVLDGLFARQRQAI